jgi:hypothetical protein
MACCGGRTKNSKAAEAARARTQQATRLVNPTPPRSTPSMADRFASYLKRRSHR